MGLDDIEIAVQIEIADRDPHARLLHSVVAERHATLDALLRKGTVVGIVKKEARRGIASQVNGRPAVIVKVCGYGCESEFTVYFADTGGLRDIAECSVPVVAIQRMAPVRQAPRTAI